jgi:hypothetical protein
MCSDYFLLPVWQLSVFRSFTRTGKSTPRLALFLENQVHVSLLAATSRALLSGLKLNCFGRPDGT